MTQKTLDGKSDCRKERTQGTATIRFNGKNKEIMEGIENAHKKYPCVKITVNGKRLEEIPKGWDGETQSDEVVER